MSHKNPEIVELRTPLPLATWKAFIEYKGPRRLSWPEVLARAVEALVRAEAERLQTDAEGTAGS
ncbi:MAG: hypothetical protein KF718_10040 [Polyangiaceae bacterium]|nr:hypothetical protein [Polyangiaceae bacterium]